MLFDFLLQLSISFCDWLSTCIACERTVSVIKGIKFDKSLSVRTAKRIIPTLFITIVSTLIHQVFNRKLIPDPRVDERLWCVLKFPTNWLQTYNDVMHLFNSIIPFLINLMSMILLIIALARLKQKTGKKSYLNVLKKQIKEHKDLIIGPILTLSCKLPLLVVTLVIKCIKSKWQLYLSVGCYFLSFVPLLATFAIFVLPAPSYVTIFKAKLRKLLKRF